MSNKIKRKDFSSCANANTSVLKSRTGCGARNHILYALY